MPPGSSWKCSSSSARKKRVLIFVDEAISSSVMWRCSRSRFNFVPNDSTELVLLGELLAAVTTLRHLKSGYLLYVFTCREKLVTVVFWKERGFQPCPSRLRMLRGVFPQHVKTYPDPNRAFFASC